MPCDRRSSRAPVHPGRLEACQFRFTMSRKARQGFRGSLASLRCLVPHVRPDAQRALPRCARFRDGAMAGFRQKGIGRRGLRRVRGPPGLAR